MLIHNNSKQAETASSQFVIESFSKKTKSTEKSIFCPACGRSVPLNFTVAGLCKDCFNND